MIWNSEMIISHCFSKEVLYLKTIGLNSFPSDVQNISRKSFTIHPAFWVFSVFMM